MKSKKKLIIIVVAIVLVLACISALAYTQVISPLSSSYSELRALHYKDNSMATDYKKVQKGQDDDAQLLSNKSYDYSDPKNFTNIYLTYKLTNNSIFKCRNMEFNVTDVGNSDNRFMCRFNSTGGGYISAFETTEVTCNLYVYTKGLSNEQIGKLLQQLKLEIHYDQDIWGAKSMSVAIPDDIKITKIETL